MNEDYTTVRKILTWATMLNNCLYPWMVIGVLADECDEAAANTLVKDLSIDEVFGDVKNNSELKNTDLRVPKEKVTYEQIDDDFIA